VRIRVAYFSHQVSQLGLTVSSFADYVMLNAEASNLIIILHGLGLLIQRFVVMASVELSCLSKTSGAPELY